MSLSDLVTLVGTKIYHTLSGDHDEDYFLTQDDMSEGHWEMLMSCHHQGQCDDDCSEASKYFEIKDYDSAKNYLVGCGIEEEKFLELYDDEDEDSKMVNNEDTILNYYLWMLSGDIQERSDDENN